jgi:hypothetical protein
MLMLVSLYALKTRPAGAEPVLPELDPLDPPLLLEPPLDDPPLLEPPLDDPLLLDPPPPTLPPPGHVAPPGSQPVPQLVVAQW